MLNLENVVKYEDELGFEKRIDFEFSFGGVTYTTCVVEVKDEDFEMNPSFGVTCSKKGNYGFTKIYHSKSFKAFEDAVDYGNKVIEGVLSGKPMDEGMEDVTFDVMRFC